MPAGIGPTSARRYSCPMVGGRMPSMSRRVSVRWPGRRDSRDAGGHSSCPGRRGDSLFAVFRCHVEGDRRTGDPMRVVAGKPGMRPVALPSWGLLTPRLCLYTRGSGLSLPMTTTSSAREYAACSRPSRRSRSSRSAADLDSLLAAVARDAPDVVLTDIRMPPLGLDEGIQAATRLRETHPEVGVVVLSQYAEPGYALALLEDGTAGRGYLLKERVDDLDQLVGRDPGGRSRRLGDRPEGRREPRRREGTRRGLAAHRADGTRARRAARDGRGQEQRRDRARRSSSPSDRSRT